MARKSTKQVSNSPPRSTYPSNANDDNPSANVSTSSHQDTSNNASRSPHQTTQQYSSSQTNSNRTNPNAWNKPNPHYNNSNSSRGWSVNSKSCNKPPRSWTSHSNTSNSTSGSTQNTEQASSSNTTSNRTNQNAWNKPNPHSTNSNSSLGWKVNSKSGNQPSASWTSHSNTSNFTSGSTQNTGDRFAHRNNGPNSSIRSSNNSPKPPFAQRNSAPNTSSSYRTSYLTINNNRHGRKPNHNVNFMNPNHPHFNNQNWFNQNGDINSIPLDRMNIHQQPNSHHGPTNFFGFNFAPPSFNPNQSQSSNRFSKFLLLGLTHFLFIINLVYILTLQNVLIFQ